MLQYYTAGDNALLAEFGGSVSGVELAAADGAVRALSEVESCTIGHASIYVVFRKQPAAGTREALHEAVSGASRLATTSARRREHRFRVSVHPDASPDLPLLMEVTGVSRDELIREMGQLRLTVRYCGFRPGFAYLEGLPTSWVLGRHPRPRASVPAGAFAIAGPMCAFYPARSPGGWNLIGRTDAVLWDPERVPPNLLAAGDSVCIDPVEELLAPPELKEMQPPIEGELLATFVAAGQNTVIAAPRDPGRLEYGLPPSGPFDEEAARLSNRAVGNEPEEAVLECAMVGPVLEFSRPGLLSWFGSSVEAILNGAVLRDTRQIAVRGGDVLEIGRITGGMRGVLAVRGGVIDLNPRFSLEPWVVKTGDTLRAREGLGNTTRLRDSLRTDRTRIAVRRGPHTVSDELFERLLDRRWTVTRDLNRVGIRLTCGEVTAGIPADLPSCGMQFGTVQWHAGGDLVVMGPDHPVTGGYLQPMTVLSGERWKLAQLMPGDEVKWSDE